MHTGPTTWTELEDTMRCLFVPSLPWLLIKAVPSLEPPPFSLQAKKLTCSRLLTFALKGHANAVHGAPA